MMHIVGWISIDNFLFSVELVLLTLRIVQILQPFQKLQTASNVFFLQYGKFWFDMCIRLGWYLCKLPTMKGLPIITRPAFNQIDNQNVGSLYQKNCKEQWNLTQLIILLQFLTKVKKKLLFLTHRICVSFFFSWMANREFDQPLS